MGDNQNDAVGMGLHRLRYDVVKVSSMDPNHPVSHIQADHQTIAMQNQGASSNYTIGWMSQKFCEYP
jgi:hypothetical protein